MKIDPSDGTRPVCERFKSLVKKKNEYITGTYSFEWNTIFGSAVFAFGQLKSLAIGIK